MTVVNFEITKVFPNPFQTRMSEDPEHVKSVAMSIAEQGLLQIPSARMLTGQVAGAGIDPKVQLVFGHTRLAAYKFLTDTGNLGFTIIPLNIVEMTDEQMFQAAVAENRERKDLTPIEEATAMQVYIDQFHKTSEEVGQLFHLSDSAVRGKLRLLGLPDEVKSLVGTTITEGAARELVTFLDLPEELLSRKNSWEKENMRETIFDFAAEGASKEFIAENITRLIFNYGKNMKDKPWRHTDDLVGEGIIGICKGCAFLQKRDNQDICLKPECYEAKLVAWRRSYLEQASLLSGIPILEDEKTGYGGHTSFQYGRESKLATIRAGRCENLRLKYEDHSHTLDKSITVDGFDHAEIVCCKTERFCSCLNAMAQGIKVGDGAELAGEELKDLNRQVREQKRIDAEFIEYMRNLVEIALVKALQDGEFETWKYCISDSSYQSYAFQDCKTLNDIYSVLAKNTLKYLSTDKRSALITCNDILKKCGLQELDIDLGEPEPVNEVKGKTLMEVFAEEEAKE